MTVGRALVVLLLLGVLGGCVTAPSDQANPDLSRLRVVPRAEDIPAYDRSCSKGHACSFGAAWTDDVTVAGGHSGCGTRDEILSRDLQRVTFKPRTHGCVVASGQLHDPYTGQVVEYRRGSNPQPVEVDHVFGLHASWNRGAAFWPQQRRTDLANDPRNLLTTTSSVNESKSDKTPEAWKPPARAGWCTYAHHFYDVALSYDLGVTSADVRSLRVMFQAC